MTATSDARREEVGVDGPTVELKFVDQNGKQFWTDADGRISYDDPEEVGLDEREALEHIMGVTRVPNLTTTETTSAFASAIIAAGWRSPAQVEAAIMEGQVWVLRDAADHLLADCYDPRDMADWLTLRAARIARTFTTGAGE